MINSSPPPPPAANADVVEVIVAAGPSGALWVAGIATALVICLWFAFYFLVFAPRGAAL